MKTVRLKLTASLLLVSVFCFNSASAQQNRQPTDVELEPNTVLAARGDVEVTFGDFQAYLATVPEEHRQGVANSPERIGKILDNMLENRLIAAQARNSGLDDEPRVVAQLQLMKDQVLARNQMQRVAEKADPANYEQQAREYYLTHQDEFRTAEKVTVRHVLVSTKERPPEEARQIAEEVAQKARAGETPFKELVEEYSDDPGARNNQGLYTFAEGEMVKPFQEASFALEEAGAIAGPVKTEFGYHVIRLEEKHPSRIRDFEEVRSKLVADARQRYLKQVRQSYVSELLRANELEARPEVIAALREYYRPENTEKVGGTGGQ